MRVLFLVQKLDTPSTRWRVTQLVPHFERAGVECRVEELPAGVLGKLSAAKHGEGFDVVVLQKRLLQRLVYGRVRRFAKRLVFEFDDAITLKKTAEGVGSSPTRERRFARTVRGADAVITTNEYLAEQARRAAASPELVHVLPSAIDVARWTPRGPAKREGAPVIGWAGSASMLPQLDIVRAPLVRVARRHRGLKLRVVCDETCAMEGIEVEHRPFAIEREVEDLGSFDIAIAPQVEDAWTRAKVSAKMLSYFAAGVPVVASDVSAHRSYVKDGVNGFLAGTLSAWEEKLERLIAEPDLREKLGRAGRETAEREFSVSAVVPKYVELFRKLAAQPTTA